MREIPSELMAGPFTRATATQLGVTPKMLRGKRFKRLHPRVFCVDGTPLTEQDLVRAAQLALPNRVHLTGLSRLRRLGLDYGPAAPVRFVIEGDHHLAIPGIFLHRTVKLPPLDDVGVTVEAAFIAYCAQARVIDAIKVGDWLLHRGYMSRRALVELASSEPWRDGADEALWVSNFLITGSRSLMESEMRAVLEFAGLPPAEANQELELGDERMALGDLTFRRYKLVVEYEGSHHQEDRKQYRTDIERYAVLRRHGYEYVQVTKEHLARPRKLVERVHAELVARGYDGPPPKFDEQWRVLFTRLRNVVGPRSVRSSER